MTDYQEFLRTKQDYGSQAGFEPLWLPEFLFDFQRYLTEWAIRKGRAAIFADCGLGKTPMQLVWADNIIRKTNRPVLVLTPLAVSRQTLEEAEKFGIQAYRADPERNPVAIQVTNYEQLHKYDTYNYAGIVCDESSILKNFNGTRRGEITEFMRSIPYRLLCTATAAPNDWSELGTSSEALGYLGHRDMLTRFFKRQQTYALTDRGGRKEWQLKGHAAAGPFWQWVASWARVVRAPADLDFDNDGFVLPPLRQVFTEIKASEPTPGMLFDMPAVTFHEAREALRRTISDRCSEVVAKVKQNGGVSMVWCNLNAEGDCIERLIPASVQVSGSDSTEHKEEAAHWFVRGSDTNRVLISKPSIFGFGLNFQHCNHMTYFPTYSYEQYYQASRRLWRFGQTAPVVVDFIYTNGGKRMLDAIVRKSKDADAMFDNLLAHMGQALTVKDEYKTKEKEVPSWMT